MKIIDPSVSLIWATADPLRIIERIGRICYKSEDKITDDSAEKFVCMLIKRNHEAMLEHVCASVLIITDRGISHELVRHRIASYAQESTRYCNYSSNKFGGEISVIRPTIGVNQLQFWFDSIAVSEKSYLEMIKSGVSPQIARSLLPTCLKTEIVMTANAREFRHFLRLRTSEAAHPQMREIADMILSKLREWCSVLFSDL